MSGPRWSTGSWLGPEGIAVSGGGLKELVRSRSLDQINGDALVDRSRLKRIPCHVHVLFWTERAYACPYKVIFLSR